MPNDDTPKLWRIKYRLGAKEKRLVVGPYPDVFLTEARDKCDLVRKELREGRDPALTFARKQLFENGEQSFEAVARRWQFGDQEIEVEIAMAVAAHVDRHAIHKPGEIGAMIEVEAAQEILVGLALTRMLSSDNAGHILHQFTGAGYWLILEIAVPDGPLAGAGRDADLRQGAAINDDRRVRQGRLLGRSDGHYQHNAAPAQHLSKPLRIFDPNPFALV
jgi:hypothetical protein